MKNRWRLNRAGIPNVCDAEFNAGRAAFAACILAAGVVPFLLGFIGVLLAAVLVPASTGMFARHWVQATQRSTAAAAWFCGLTITPLASWFGGMLRVGYARPR